MNGGLHLCRKHSSIHSLTRLSSGTCGRLLLPSTLSFKPPISSPKHHCQQHYYPVTCHHPPFTAHTEHKRLSTFIHRHHKHEDIISCSGKRLESAFMKPIMRLESGFMNPQMRLESVFMKHIMRLESAFMKHTMSAPVSPQVYYSSSKDDGGSNDDDGGGGGGYNLGPGGIGPLDNAFQSLLTTLLVVGLLLYTLDNLTVVREVSFSFFQQHMLSKGEVALLVVSDDKDKVYVYLHRGAIINGMEAKWVGPHCVFTISGVDSFERKLNLVQDELGISPSGRVPISYKVKQSELVSFLTTTFILVCFAVGLYGLITNKRGGKGMDTTMFSSPFDFVSRARPTIITEHNRHSIKFKNVAGMEEAKREVMEFVDYLKDPKRFTALGARIPKGALLHGPPGTGKTLLARAIAAEASVPFLAMNGTDFVEKFGGVGAARVRDLYNQAREHAPCILYIDEIDTIGKARGQSSSGGGEEESTLNQLLVEMDGINPLEGVVMLASTNRAEVLDQALLRPGRFDRQVSIDLPTLPERKAIFEVYLREIVLENQVESYSSRLAALTPGHSGADIASIVNEAALHAARYKGLAVKERDFEYAIERIIAGMTKKTQVLTPEEREVVAYHEAGHALTGWLLEHTDPVMKVSITPRTKGILGFAQHLPSDQKLYTTQQLFDRMCMTLGGRAAEAITFKKITTGAQNDLEKVTKMAYRQVVEYGMSPTIGHISLNVKGSKGYTKTMYSNKLSSMIDREVQSIVNKAYQETETLLTNNSDRLKKLAQGLLEKEVLNYKDIVSIIGDMPHKKKHHQHHSELADLW